MRFRPHRAVIALCLLTCTATALADGPMAGKFTDGKLTVDWSASGDGYAGTFTLGDRQFPATAHGGPTAADGTFSAIGNRFPFTASLDGDTLHIATAGTAYALKRVLPPNTLTDAPAGFAVAASNSAGKSMVAQKPAARSIQAALESTFPDLAAYFGSRPKIGSSYEDAHDHRTGGATFTADDAGKLVRGIVSCKLIDGGGATVAVVYGRPDASKSDWQALVDPHVPPLAPPPAPPTATPAPAEVPPTLTTANAKEYDLPDGTGSIMLPEGWTTTAQSATDAILVEGSAGQRVVLNSHLMVLTPDSPTLQMMRRNRAMMEQMGARTGRPPPPAAPMTMIVAPYTDPDHAVADLTAEYSRINQIKGGPAVTFDRITSHRDMPSAIAGGQAAAVGYETTRAEHGSVVHTRQWNMVQMQQVGNGTWSFMYTGFNAPVDCFDRDKLLMAAILNSFKLNNDAYTQRMQANNQQAIAQIKAQGEAENAALKANHDMWQAGQDSRNRIHNEQHDAQMAGYAAHNQQEMDRQLQKQRSAADFIETIKGTRTVYDTVTGATGTADLNYVNGVVDSLNQAALDPNRFVQIPLRDEMYPVRR